MTEHNGLSKEGLPNESGVYLVRGIFGVDDTEENTIDVYEHPVKGLSCYSDDLGDLGSYYKEIDEEFDCHISVRNTGLEFITKIRNLD